MTVITLSACPEKLKGDITRWMFEIDTGVYVGNLSARVRELLWERICDNIGSGRASMAFSTNNEQKFDIRIHGCKWEPLDYDGIKLVRRNFENSPDDDYKKRSKAVVNHIAGLAQKNKVTGESADYVIIDVETTGVGDNDKIIEAAALKVRNGIVTEEYSALVKYGQKLPDGIVKLTGITDHMLAEEGIEQEKAAAQFAQFCGSDVIVGHNIVFDMKYLQKLLKQCGIPLLKNKTVDTMRMARKKEEIPDGYSLSSICRYYGIDVKAQHRAKDDCYLTYRIYEKLKEK